MTTISEEARKKLKAIMSTKLVELVGHCESELPDYVVSMIANNKSKDYMKKNLEVFIGDHSEEFSEWLAELKEKINKPEKSDAAKPQSPSPVVIPESSKTTAKPEKKSEKTEKKEEKKVDKPKEEDHSRKRKRIEYDIKTEENRKSRSDRRDKQREERKRSASRDRHSRKNSRREDSPARRRRARSKTWSDDEMGDPVPAEKKVASSIVVPRAVQDGPKSVSSSVTVKRKIVTDTDKSAKSRSNIFFKAMNDASRADGAQSKNDKNKVTVEVGSDSDMEGDDRVVSTQKKGSKKEGSPTVRVRLDIPSAPFATVDGQKVAQKRKIVWDIEEDQDQNNKKETRSRPVLKRAFSPSSSKKKSFEDQENEAAIDAFIAATNLEMAIKDGDDEDNAMSDSDEPHMKHKKMMSHGEDGDDSMETGFLKPKPRCNFWPGCTKGDACEYVHPSVPCTKFPRCAFGKQCIYIHPPCKFGFNCRNPNCPAVHGDAAAIELVDKLLGIQAQPPAPTTFQSQNMTLKRTTVPIDAALETPTSEIPCRFRNMCKNPNCAYKHPAICRFGWNCHSHACPFRHVETQPPKPTLPAADKYKWKAAA